jgi:hypothetical protein
MNGGLCSVLIEFGCVFSLEDLLIGSHDENGKLGERDVESIVCWLRRSLE